MGRKIIREKAKDYFLKNVVMTVDSRENENREILETFRNGNISYEIKKGSGTAFIYGDYSFYIDGVDYRTQVIFERKKNLGELFSNVNDKNKTERHTDGLRNNLERELHKMNKFRVAERWLMFGGVDNLRDVRKYKFDHTKVEKPSQGFINQAENAGKTIYATLMAWQCSNRHNFKMYCSKNELDLAREMVSISFYYWRNKMKKMGKIKNGYYYFD